MTEQQPIATAPQADVPPMPEAPPVVAAEPPPVVVEPPVKKDRRVLRAVLRWTAAVVVLAAVGSSTAYGITRMERTDVPGLATETDGRWTYPEITKPPLPSGSPAPFTEANPASVHYADLRALLLPAPKGAKADKALPGRDGWLAKKDFLSVYGSKEDRDDLGQVLTDHGLRHVAARGWTAPDGTRTRIYLLQFDSGQVADVLQQDHLTSYDSPNHALRGAAEVHTDEEFPSEAEVMNVRHYSYTESKPYGAEQVRQAYLVSGDVVGLVVQSRKGGAAAVPFQQTVILQSQLLD
ncbi:hypothetical protein DMH25_22070 [Streptomyces sp. WAC 01325]|uniref:hypothetical protein n=1 Tax=Streptomyces sp. WAC 01325 TaxID=2203202 RepID=UPI000F8949F2|nr:hypothetical protein [Streptomyces sp. WAC 01325]RSN03929.1 hypothetical protein DMH25_22070 [Streptomyces sp. WAC 01325]WCH92944.1 hypothetical protein POD33_12820 [Streptomyces moderatus]